MTMQSVDATDLLNSVGLGASPDLSKSFLKGGMRTLLDLWTIFVLWQWNTTILEATGYYICISVISPENVSWAKPISVGTSHLTPLSPNMWMRLFEIKLLHQYNYYVSWQHSFGKYKSVYTSSDIQSGFFILCLRTLQFEIHIASLEMLKPSFMQMI